MSDTKLSIRQAKPIPGVGYSQYEVSVEAGTKAKLVKAYEEAEAVMLDILENQKVICGRDLLAKYLHEKGLTEEFISWLSKNGK